MIIGVKHIQWVSTNLNVFIITLLGGALADQLNFLYSLGQNSAAEKNDDTSQFWIIFENSQNCRQIIGTPRRSIFLAAKSSQMQYTATNQKIYNKIKNSLELRLA